MIIRFAFLLTLGTALVVPEFVSAQPGYMRRAGYDQEDARSSKKSRAKKKRGRKRGDEVESPRSAGSDKDDIESYLQSRLKSLKKTHRAQGNFGRRMKSSWDNFWNKVYEDRKLFEVRLARQRLNLFESLASLDKESHQATITDFDKLQNTQIKAFETDLRNRMHQYFGQLNADLKEYAQKQESSRQEFMADAMRAWKAQRLGARR